MGAGRGYWSRLLQLRGVDIISYDVSISGDQSIQQIDDEKDSEHSQEDLKDSPRGGRDADVVPAMNWCTVYEGTPEVCHWTAMIVFTII